MLRVVQRLQQQVLPLHSVTFSILTAFSITLKKGAPREKYGKKQNFTAFPFFFIKTHCVFETKEINARCRSGDFFDFLPGGSGKKGALFSQLTKSGSTIFEGMKMIIYAVAGFGIVGVAIGGFFGNLNWKWLSAIIIGLLVIAMTAGILMYMTESDIKENAITIQDSLINAS